MALPDINDVITAAGPVASQLSFDNGRRPGGDWTAMRHSPAVPEPLLRVEVADIPHPMPDGCPVRDLAQGIALRPVQVLARDDWPTDDQLADLACW